MARLPVLLVFLVVALGLGTAAADLASRGHPIALPLDDAYIPLQYARTALAGDPASYVPGDPPSAGATSPLWVGLLVVLGAVVPGAAGSFPAVALALCTLATALTLGLAYGLARRHGAGIAGALSAPIALLLTPYWLFGSMNGMETGLYGAALLAGAFALGGGSAAWLLPLALVRPEGAVLALGILAVRAARTYRTAARARPADPNGPGPAPPASPKRHDATLGLVVAAAALATLAWPWILTGGPSSAWTAKALWTEPRAEVRAFYLPRLPYFAARILWFGLSGGRTQPPLGVASDFVHADAWGNWIWALFTLGGILAALLGRRARGPLALWVAASLAALAGVAWDAHHYRYLIPAYPLLVVAATAGWFGSTWRPAAERRRARLRAGAPGGRRVPMGGRPVHLARYLAGGVLLVSLVAGAVAAPNGVASVSRRFYRTSCERIAHVQGAAGDWIRGNLPADARVAAHDVGAIAFLGERPVTDLVGLASPALGNAYRHGEGALWEALDALPADRRPTHAAVVPAWMPYLSRTFWFGERLWATGTASATGDRAPVSRDLEIRRLNWPGTDEARWPGGDFANLPALHGHAGGEVGWALVDGVDVADLVSERAHDYRDDGPVAETVVRDLGFASRLLPAARAHAVEGGRVLRGAASFTLRLPAAAALAGGRGAPGPEALLVLRSASPREHDLTVQVNGWAGTLRVPQGETVFHEPALRIPREVLAAAADGRLDIAIEGDGVTAFHWWLLVGR